MLKLELFKTGAKMANNWPCEIGWFISIRCFGHTNWSMPWTPATRMNEHVSCELTGNHWNLTISVDTVGLWDASILNYWFWIRITAPAYPSAHQPMQDAMGKCIVALFLPTAPLTTPAFLAFLLIGGKLLLKLMHAQLTSRHWVGVRWGC